jgi:DNA-binding transcriptional MerR regulator
MGAAAASAAAVDDSRELFGIAELCREFAITPRALRFYESKGLLTPQRVGATRVYTRRERARLAIILRSKAIGASLEEIGHFLALYGDHGEGRVRQLRWLKERTDAAIAELEAKRGHIDALLAEIRAINQGVSARLAVR